MQNNENVDMESVIDIFDTESNTSSFEVSKKSRKEILAEKKGKKHYLREKVNLDYSKYLQDNSSNKRSVWLNIIAFLVPILGIFWCFYYLLKSPKRSKSMLKVVGVSLLLQICLIVFCYLFLFEYLGNWCLVLFG